VSSLRWKRSDLLPTDTHWGGLCAVHPAAYFPHDYARIATEASLAARDQDKYWEMHDLLIKRSPKLDRASFIQYAKELGLDVKKFTGSIDSQKHARDIDRDLELAVTMDLYTTPTFYIFTGEKWLVSGRSIISGRLLMRS